MFNDVINNGGLFEVKLDRYLMKYVDSLIVNTSASQMETVGEKKKAERTKFTVISKNQKKVNRNESSS